MNKKKVTAIVSSAPAKAAAAVGSLVASGAALASGGGAGSPGAAIAGELGGGKVDVMLVISACALILGAIILWRYVKKAG